MTAKSKLAEGRLLYERGKLVEATSILSKLSVDFPNAPEAVNAKNIIKKIKRDMQIDPRILPSEASPGDVHEVLIEAIANSDPALEFTFYGIGTIVMGCAFIFGLFFLYSSITGPGDLIFLPIVILVISGFCFFWSLRRPRSALLKLKSRS